MNDKKVNILLRRVFKLYQKRWFLGELKSSKSIKPKSIEIKIDTSLATEIANYLYNNDLDFQKFHNRMVTKFVKVKATEIEKQQIEDDIIKKYVVNGGQLFRVEFITKLRDGGTTEVRTNKGSFYSPKDSNEFHTEYPMTNENRIADIELITYLFERIETHLERTRAELDWNTNWFREIKTSN